MPEKRILILVTHQKKHNNIINCECMKKFMGQEVDTLAPHFRIFCIRHQEQEKKYTYEQIRLTDADGVKVLSDLSINPNTLPDRDRAELINSFGGLTPLSMHVTNISLNGQNASVQYWEFPSSNNANSAYQNKSIQFDKLNQSASKSQRKAISCGNYVIGISTGFNIKDEIANKLQGKIR